MNGCLRHRESFTADQRGAVAFEMPFIFLFLMLSLLFPLADVAIAGFQYASAGEALRAFGQSIQYAPPPDVTSASSWTSSALAKAVPGFPISNFQLVCGDTKSVCSTTNTASPKYYSYTTTVTLAPMLLKSVLCTSGNADPCTYTLPYSERFQ
jgi:Flp pilus assembly protein TadG